MRKLARRRACLESGRDNGVRGRIGLVSGVRVGALLLATSLLGGMSVSSWVLRANDLGFEPSWIAGYFLAVGVGNWCYLRLAAGLIRRFGASRVGAGSMVVCCVGAFALAVVDNFWIALPIGLVLQGAYPVATTCLLSVRPAGESRGLMAGRGLYSLGAILGYPAGTLLCSIVGEASALVFVGGCQLGLAIAVWRVLGGVREAQVGRDQGTDERPARTASRAPLTLVMLSVCIACWVSVARCGIRSFR